MAACGDDDVATGGAGGASTTTTSATTGGEATSSASTGSGGAPSCEVNEVPLFVSSSGGVPDRFHVPVRFDGQDAALLFDTGSALTFVLLGEGAPDYVPDAGVLEIGCDTISVAGRGGFADLGEEAGLPVIGILGVDYVAAGTTLVDHDAELLVRHPSGTELRGTESWSVLPYEDVQGHMIAPADLDATSVRLMFDTGAPHILWLGQQGQPGDQEVTTSDAEGNPLTLYFGDVLLGMAGEPPHEVPVLRAPSFPYFEQTVAALGGNIHGLLGLSALEGRRWVVDGAAQAIRIEPR